MQPNQLIIYDIDYYKDKLVLRTSESGELIIFPTEIKRVQIKDRPEELANEDKFEYNNE